MRFFDLPGKAGRTRSVWVSGGADPQVSDALPHGSDDAATDCGAPSFALPGADPHPILRLQA